MKFGRLFLILTILICSRPAGDAAARDSLLVMFWNLENFFDWKDEGKNDSDGEFSSRGERRWTRKRFYAKCNAVAKTVLWISDKYGRLPDIIGIAEVENRFVIKQLINSTALWKYDYGIIHYDSPDPRGIDVAMLYRKSIFDTIKTKACRVDGGTLSGHDLKTRDILLSEMKQRSDGRYLAVLVNHHPSKYGGASKVWRRQYAIKKLASIVDSLSSSGRRDIIVTGDFNDTPDAPLFDSLTFGGRLEEIPVKGGTIRYNGKWERIDMFFASPSISALCPRMYIASPPFLTVTDKSHQGDRPFRTYVGPRYIGGVSDHRPILLKL